MDRKQLLPLILLSIPALLQAGNIDTQEFKMNRKGKQVKVYFTAIIPDDAVRSTHRLIVTPQLFTEKGESVSLEPFTVSGRKRARRDKQQRLLAKNGTLPAGYTITGNNLAYAGATDYKTWMGEKVSVRLNISEEGCCKVKNLEPDIIAWNQPLNFDVKPLITRTRHEKSQVSKRAATIFPFLRMLGKDTVQQRGISVRFRLAKTGIDPDYLDNREHLNKILEAISLVEKEKRTRLEKITITGYASPEGSQKQNKQLSEGRANALKNYISSNMNIPDDRFQLTAGGSDWQGLQDLVQKSDMPYKKEIIAIIEQTPEEGRNTRLLKLAGGRPYASMNDVIYPQLRDACYINVWYSEQTDTVADTVNEAIELIMTHRYDEALTRLETVKQDTRSWNAIGVCRQMRGDMEEAQKWFSRAAEAGDTEADENLKQINN